MQIEKSALLQFLRYKGQHDQAHEAQQELPDQVDIDKHANQRSKFGLSPTDLLGRLVGGLDGL